MRGLVRSISTQIQAYFPLDDSADCLSILMGRPQLLPILRRIGSIKYSIDRPGNLIHTRVELIDAVDGLNSGFHLLTVR